MSLKQFIQEQRNLAAKNGKGDPEIEKLYNELVDGLKERISKSPFQTVFGHSVALEQGHGFEPDYLRRELARLAVKNNEELKFDMNLDENLKTFLRVSCEG